MYAVGIQASVMTRKRKIFSVWKYIKNYKFSSLFFKNFLLILLLVVMPLLIVSMVTYIYSGRILEEEVKKANTRSLLKVQGTMDMIQDEIGRITVQLANDYDVIRFANHLKAEYPQYSDIETIVSIMKETIYLSKDYIESVFIYSKLNDYLLTPHLGSKLDRSVDLFWCEGYKNMPESSNTYYALTYIDKNLSTEKKLITFYKKILINQSIDRGVIIVNIPLESLKSLLSNSLQNDSEILFILDGEQRIIFSTKDEWVDANFSDMFLEGSKPDDDSEPGEIINFDGQEYILSSISSESSDWAYCSILPKSDYYIKQLQLKSLMIWSMSILLPLAIIAAYMLSVRVFRPIDEVIDMLENPLDIPGHDDLSSELKLIAGNIMRSHTEHQQSEREIKRRVNMLNAARVKALQAQINPHFLNNTLQALNWLILKETGDEDALSIEVLEQLSELVRSNMETNKNTSSLKDEIEYVNKYISIQKLRYGDKINLAVRIPPELTDSVILKMSLQPLVENAIYHGLKQIEGRGYITISAKPSGDKLVIFVEDNGAGMEDGDIKALNVRLAEAESIEDNHIGLYNVNLRLKLVFGPEAEIVLSKNPTGGIITRMTIPRHIIINMQD